jgi:hypothetical protein
MKKEISAEGKKSLNTTARETGFPLSGIPGAPL